MIIMDTVASPFVVLVIIKLNLTEMILSFGRSVFNKEDDLLN